MEKTSMCLGAITADEHGSETLRRVGGERIGSLEHGTFLREGVETRRNVARGTRVTELRAQSIDRDQNDVRLFGQMRAREPRDGRRPRRDGAGRREPDG